MKKANQVFNDLLKSTLEGKPRKHKKLDTKVSTSNTKVNDVIRKGRTAPFLTEEQRRANAKKAAETRQRKLAKLSPEELARRKAEITAKAKATRERNLAKLSPEEIANKKASAVEKARNTRREKWESLTPAEQFEVRLQRRLTAKQNAERRREMFNAMSPEEKARETMRRQESARKGAQTRRENFERLSPEEQQEITNRRIEQARKNFELDKPKEERKSYRPPRTIDERRDEIETAEQQQQNFEEERYEQDIESLNEPLPNEFDMIESRLGDLFDIFDKIGLSDIADTLRTALNEQYDTYGKESTLFDISQNIDEIIGEAEEYLMKYREQIEEGHFDLVKGVDNTISEKLVVGIYTMITGEIPSGLEMLDLSSKYWND